ncbi:uncharacterized protein N7496_006605 [Penicillium cataractarum]|uniref:Phytanoyl-CoA dioxygenase n=1 Tax=Penicillium cataractarum TaxID=2100454 RepID=A0A9W9S6G7_9EURO|nr:uncharacterized protein N7496_006605 [Penicillium cataractarum]KAJ5370513.1 hypothetical protein N7496_006605 [Penicillium cataractarum]
MSSQVTETHSDLLVHDGKPHGNWRDDFFKNGYAIIKGVISKDRAEYYRQQQFKWLKSFGLGFDENDEATWDNDHLPVAFKGGMYLAYSAAHEKFMWEGRLEPAVQKVFADIWGTDELLVSFDGFNMTPPRLRGTDWKPWPHCDQHPLRRGLQCVQGLMNFAPNGPKDGGLLLMEGSSQLYDTFFKENRQQEGDADRPKDLFIFTQEDVKWFEARGCKLIKVCLEPGDFVVWDSRTMHYACFPDAESQTIRSIQYICMTPAKFATKEDLELKAELFKGWNSTTHWPHCNIHRQGAPMRNGEVDPLDRKEPLEKPVLSDRLLQLAGVKAY